MKKWTFAELFDNKKFLIVFSALASVILYIGVAMTNKDDIEKTIYNVPVKLDQQSTNLANLRLNIIEGNEYFVDVTVTGPRTVVGQLKPDSPELATTARLSEITERGEHTVPVVTAFTDTAAPDFQIVEYSPRSVKVRVSRMRSTTFDIKPIVNGLSVAPGFVSEKEYTTQQTVTVTGPDEELAKVASAEVTLELTEPLEQTYARTLPIVLKDIQGEPIIPEQGHLTLDISEAELVVLVLKTTGLPLEVVFPALPKGFPEDQLRQVMTITPDFVNIAGPADVINRIREIPVAYIDIKELQPGNTSFNFPLGTSAISSQIQSLDNVTGVSVYFDDYNWETASFNIQNIELINIPGQYNVSLPFSRINGVQFVGDKDVLNSMTADDIVAEVDLSDRELLPGQYSYPVKISVPGKGLVWALGDQTATIQVMEKL